MNNFLNSAAQTASKSWASTFRMLQPFIKRFAELAVMVFGCWLTWKGLEWSFQYADKALTIAEATEAGVALVIGAILGPLLTFTGVIVKLYLTHSNGHENGNASGEQK